jgi:hypothetical protein
MCHTSVRRLFPGLVLALASIGACGCGGKPTSSASGKVTLKGAALKSKVLLTFVGPDNVPRSAQTDASGEFTISGLAVGTTRVTVVPLPVEGPTPRAPGKMKDKADAGPRLSALPAAEEEIPFAYGDAAHPQLTYTLQTGHNALDIDLGTSTE